MEKARRVERDREKEIIKRKGGLVRRREEKRGKAGRKRVAHGSWRGDVISGSAARRGATTQRGNRKSTFAYSRTERSGDNERDSDRVTIERSKRAEKSELRVESAYNAKTDEVRALVCPRRDIHLFRGPCFICLYLCNSLYRAIPPVICP